MHIDLEALLKMDGRSVRAYMLRNQGREGKYQYGLPGAIGVLINSRCEWQETGVKTKPAAEARKGNCASILLNRSAAVLEAEAEKLLEKAKKLRQMALEANT
jgi:hypothetical protein